MIERVASKAEVRQAVSAARREGRTIGLVPTMGALHEGHLSLVRAACDRASYVVVSIFVNPTQFAPGEDFERYPRDLVRDLDTLSAAGADIAFVPSVAEMYGTGIEVGVEPGSLASLWEGEVRPGHFEGVATVVTKLLSIVRPDVAFFGEKDYQQLKVVERVASDLDTGTRIVACPTVRDADGLALSSRNAYLTGAEREAARAIPDALKAAASAVAWGERDATALSALMRQRLEDAGLAVDYAAVVDPSTLEPLATLDAPAARALIAARVGETRLIDNCQLTIPQESA